MEYIQKLKNFLFRRQQAYQQTFNENNPFAELVLKDLNKFCRGTASTFHEKERFSLILQGRNEVWLRIMQHVKMNPDKFWETFGYPDEDI